MKDTQLKAILGVIDRETDRGTLSVIAGRIAQRTQFLTPVTEQPARSTRGSRRSGKAVPNEAGFVIGDDVIFGDFISPRYLEGRKAKVVGTNTKSVILDTPDELGYGRFRNVKGMRCPNSLVRKKEVKV